MIAYSLNIEWLLKEFNEMAEIAQKKAVITIGIEIQEQEVKVIDEYTRNLISLKKEYIERKLEPEANLVYCIIGSLRAVQYELEMLVNIKRDQMAIAWDNLVNAMTTLGPVIRNYPLDNSDGIESYLQKLHTYEKLLFPKMYFHSVGYILKKAHCSICRLDPNDCDHLKGKLYMGELCCRIIVEAELLEASLVDNPANKHCRTLSMTIDGKTIDMLTFREINRETN